VEKPSKSEIHWRTLKLNNELLEVKPEFCIERARLVTQSYKETEGEPMVIRRAKAVAKVLKEMPIFIQKDQLIVGTQASKLRCAPLFPETETVYLEKEIDLFEERGQDRLIVPPEIKRELLEDILPYWKSKNIETIALNAMPDKLRELIQSEEKLFSVDIHLNGSIGHVIVDYGKILGKGFLGLKKDIEERIDKLEMTCSESSQKYSFYKSGIILCDAMIEWAGRYAKEARKMALNEKDLRWKKELEMIADICENVPANPARNFREAIQSFWFTHVMLYMEQDGLGCSVGRLDQYLYPYYKKSIDQGIITKDDAQELLECLWIKLTEVMRAYGYDCAKYFAGFSIGENLAIGGVDRDGKDATNELSYMCLEAEKNTKLTQPNLSVRVHPKSPEDFLMKAVEVVSMGRTKPEFFNDMVGVPSLISCGVPLYEARDYVISGCVEAVPPCCNGMTNAAMSNLAKAFELALHNGICQLTGKQLGPKTGDPRDFKSIDDLLEAFRIQVRAYVREMVAALHIIERIHAEYHPLPYFSLVLDDCLDKGVDVTAGGARYNFTGPQAVGLADVANSLAAVKKLVFEEKKISMEQLLEALHKNFEGKEAFRQELMNRVPKWGNDDDYVDSLASEVAKIYCNEVSQYKNTRGGIYRPGIYSLSANVSFGMHVSALPSGRLSTAPLAEGISPFQGTDIYGPTGVVKSAAKLDHEIITNGTILNQKFTPRLISDDIGKRAMLDLIRSYFDLGGWHIQFNVVSAETLRAAQRDPDAYKGLIIRVAGYSAFFIELDKTVQDDIIARTEQTHF